MKKIFILFLLALLPIGMAAYTLGRVSVHDPSIVWDPNSSSYYIFGSFREVAKTTDMMNWTRLALGTEATEPTVGVPWKTTANNNAPSADAFSMPAVTTVTVGEAVKFLPYFDAKAWSANGGTQGKGSYDITGNLWAPDVLWNPVMKKWCMYMSVNGDNWYSSIVLLTSDNIEGPYEYQAPIVISGFTNDNFEQTDLELVLGEQNSLPSRYNSPWAATSKSSYPNNIDACVFYDQEGKLWMSYGSWSGGIFMLELDESTGLRDYGVQYETSDTSDPYFGKKIAGGYYVSGEASYIEYIDGYYYLFVSYGGLQAGGVVNDVNIGGYQMRVFRSTNPDGPYVDPEDNSAIYSSYTRNFGSGATSRGENIFGCYGNWGYQATGVLSERSQGHNSIIAANDDRTYLVYHTRFQDLGELHQVRVHQVFQNEDKWLVAAPFEYTGETVTNTQIASTQQIATANIPGKYKLLIHRDGLDHTTKETVTPVEIELVEGGTISGKYTGTWTVTENTSYVQITLAGNTYKGVMIEQMMEPTDEKVVAFTAMSNSNGINIWGYKQAAVVEELPTPVYFNDFSSSDGLTQVGSGEFIEDADSRFGKIYHNNPAGNSTPRTNYLKLPADVLTHSASTKEMTIGFWVNVKTAVGTNFFHSPVFSAYTSSTPGSDNGIPMFRCSAKGVMQLNNGDGHWSDFIATENNNGMNVEASQWLDDKEWHYYTVTLTSNTGKIYVDGVILNSWTLADNTIIPAFFSTAAANGYPVVCLGGNQSWNWADIDAAFGYDDFVVYDRALTAGQIAKIISTKKAIEPVSVPTPVYFNNFSSATGVEIVGNGAFEEDADSHFGQVFHNDTENTSAVRTNYLKLPTDILSHSATSKEMTIGFWVNKKSETDYFYTPLFAAYGAAPNAGVNTWPMFVCETRGLIQLNCAGYCDFGINDSSPGTTYNDGTPYVTTTWLDDAKWHYYTVALTATTAKVYIDGELKNGWTVDGTSDGQVISGLFTGGSNLTYVTLGGNQAWGWSDADPAFAFDDFAVYDVALSPEQIAQVIANKNAGVVPVLTYNYTVTASYGGKTKTISSGTGEKDASITVAYPRYILDGTTLYEANTASNSDYYHKAFTLISDNQEETITYDKPTTSNVYYYAEGEDVMPNSANTSGASTRTSMGAVGRNTSGNSSIYTNVITLPAGTWQIGAHFYCANTSGSHTANIKVGEDVKWTKTYEAGKSGSYVFVSDAFVLTGAATVSIAVDGGNATGIDWIYIKSVNNIEVVGTTDYTTVYRGAQSTDYTIKKGDQKVITFRNFGNNSGDVWNNWVMVVKEGNVEKSVTRADSYDVIGAKNLDAKMSTDGTNKIGVDWVKFKEDMADALVEATVTYGVDGTATINAVATGAKNGYMYYVENSIDELTDDLTINLSVDHSWLEIISVEQTAVGVTTTAAGKGFATLYTDKALDFSSAEGLNAYTATLSDKTVTLTKVTDIKAGTGVVLKSDKTDQNTIYSIPVISDSETDKGELEGNATGATLYDAFGGYDLYMLAINKSNEAQFTKVNSGSVAAGKAYLKVPSSAPARALSIDYSDGSTGIHAVENTGDADGQIYSVSGQRVAKPGKGLYIVNGKKVIFK